MKAPVEFEHTILYEFAAHSLTGAGSEKWGGLETDRPYFFSSRQLYRTYLLIISATYHCFLHLPHDNLLTGTNAEVLVNILTTPPDKPSNGEIHDPGVFPMTVHRVLVHIKEMAENMNRAQERGLGDGTQEGIEQAKEALWARRGLEELRRRISAELMSEQLTLPVEIAERKPATWAQKITGEHCSVQVIPSDVLIGEHWEPRKCKRAAVLCIEGEPVCLQHAKQRAS